VAWSKIDGCSALHIRTGYFVNRNIFECQSNGAKNSTTTICLSFVSVQKVLTSDYIYYYEWHFPRFEYTIGAPKQMASEQSSWRKKEHNALLSDVGHAGGKGMTYI
jgi:hypothetical protein